MNSKDRKLLTRIYVATARAPEVPPVLSAGRLGYHVRFEQQYRRRLLTALLDVRDPEADGSDPEVSVLELDEIVEEERRRRGLA